jgi:hypothetical protein
MPNTQTSQSIEANRNEDAMRLLWTPIRDRIEIAAQGGGKKSMPRERRLRESEWICYLIVALIPLKLEL